MQCGQVSGTSDPATAIQGAEGVIRFRAPPAADVIMSDHDRLRHQTAAEAASARRRPVETSTSDTRMRHKKADIPFPWRRYLGAALLILLLASLPMLSALIAELIANANGCTLHEGNSYPCHVFGEDIGDLLYTMFVLGWLMLLTIPYGVIALALLLITLILHLLMRWWWRRG